MIEIESAEQVRRLFPSAMQRQQRGTWVQQCKFCSGTGRVLVNKSGIVGDHKQKRCKACKKDGKQCST